MVHFPVPKVLLVTAPGAKLDDAAATSTVVDTAGAPYVMVTAIFGDVDANAAVLSVSHADAKTNSTTLTSGTVISGSDLVASVTAAAGDNTVVRWFIRPSKRYIQLNFTAGNGASGTYYTGLVDLFLNELPDSNTERGLLASAFLAPA